MASRVIVALTLLSCASDIPTVTFVMADSEPASFTREDAHPPATPPLLSVLNSAVKLGVVAVPVVSVVSASLRMRTHPPGSVGSDTVFTGSGGSGDSGVKHHRIEYEYTY